MNKTDYGFSGAKLGFHYDDYSEFVMMRLSSRDAWHLITYWAFGGPGRHATGEARRAESVTAKVYAVGLALSPGLFGDIALSELSQKIGKHPSALSVYHRDFRKRFNVVGVAARQPKSVDADQLDTLDAPKAGALADDAVLTGQAIPENAAFTEDGKLVPVVQFDYAEVDRELALSAFQREDERTALPVVTGIGSWIFDGDPFCLRLVTSKIYGMGFAYGLLTYDKPETICAKAGLDHATVDQHTKEFRERFLLASG